MKHSIEQLKQFFFEAALATYASGKKASQLPNRPWAKFFAHKGEGEFADLLYLDEYATNGESSGGSTLIASAEDPKHPLWIMQYQGWCKGDDPEVLGFLKVALLEAYRRGTFRGGRGPARYEQQIDEGLSYENVLEGATFGRDGFENFRGYEQIWRRPNCPPDILFWHRYQGMLLCEPA